MSDYLDTRDLAAELAELDARADDPDQIDSLTESEAERRAALRDLAGQIADWEYGETLVPEDEWVAYAREQAEETGMVDPGSEIYAYVDWDAWADALQQDYMDVELDGVTYWTHA